MPQGGDTALLSHDFFATLPRSPVPLRQEPSHTHTVHQTLDHRARRAQPPPTLVLSSCCCTGQYVRSSSLRGRPLKTLLSGIWIETSMPYFVKPSHGLCTPYLATDTTTRRMKQEPRSNRSAFSSRNKQATRSQQKKRKKMNSDR